MRKSYKFAKKKKPATLRYRYNLQIKVPQVKVIDAQGNMLGLLPTKQALEQAQEQGYDLVEVSPNAVPPVTRFMDYGRFQYRQEKIAKKQKTKIKKVETKGIRLSAKISAHDLETRRKQTRKFLEKGNKVKIEIILRGREHQHKDTIANQIKNFIDNLGIPYQIEQDITKQGSKIFMIIMPEKQ